MDSNLEQFRRGAADLGTGAGRKFPAELKLLGATYTRRQRAAGESWSEIAKTLGVTTQTAQRWAKPVAPSTPAFHAVAVAARAPRESFVAVLPGGVRVEGLSFDALVALAKALS